MSGLQVAVEDRKADAVAHLAVARSQNTGPAFWVTTKDKGGRFMRPLFPYGRLCQESSGESEYEKIKGSENCFKYHEDDKFPPYRGICGAGGVFFCAVADSDRAAPSDYGAVYACDDEQCPRGSDSGVPCDGSSCYTQHRDPDLYAVRRDHSCHSHRSAVVCRERGSVCLIGIELHLWEHRDKKLFLCQTESISVYGNLSGGDHAVTRSLRVWQQHQRDAL